MTKVGFAWLREVRGEQEAREELFHLTWLVASVQAAANAIRGLRQSLCPELGSGPMNLANAPGSKLLVAESCGYLNINAINSSSLSTHDATKSIVTTDNMLFACTMRT